MQCLGTVGNVAVNVPRCHSTGGTDSLAPLNYPMTQPSVSLALFTTPTCLVSTPCMEPRHVIAPHREGAHESEEASSTTSESHPRTLMQTPQEIAGTRLTRRRQYTAAFSAVALLGARRSHSMLPATSLQRASMRWAPARSGLAPGESVVSWPWRWCCMAVLAAIMHAICRGSPWLVWYAMPDLGGF